MKLTVGFRNGLSVAMDVESPCCDDASNVAISELFEEGITAMLTDTTTGAVLYVRSVDVMTVTTQPDKD